MKCVFCQLCIVANLNVSSPSQILNTLPFGIGVTASSRVGNFLGSRSAYMSRVSANMSALLATVVGALVLAVLMGTRSRFGRLFSDDADVVALVAEVLPYVAAFQIFDGWAQSCGGVLRGMGKQKIGAGVNLVAYYLLALPVGIWLAFNTGLGLAGLWIGQCGALFLVGVGEYLLVFLTDWDVEVKRAEQRIENEDSAAGAAEGGERGRAGHLVA